jgi:hypothetical protein
MRLIPIRLFCFVTGLVCCLGSSGGQEKETPSKTRIHASRIQENVARIYREMPGLEPSESRSRITDGEPGKAHLVPVTLPSILPARLKEAKTTVQLPSEFSDVAEGGGGRFLIFYLKKLNQLAVFDVSAARIIKYLPLDAEDVAIAASADKLLVVARDKGFIRRYDLLTFEQELTKPLPEPDMFYRIAMGSASNGPFLLCSGEQLPKQWVLYDLATLEPNGMQVEADRFDVRGGRELLLRASANGRLFTLHDLHHAASIVVGQKSITKHFNTHSGGYPFPSADGKTIYLNGKVYNREMKLQASPFKLPGIPSSSGDFFLTRGDDAKSSTLQIMQPGNPEPLVSVPDIGEPTQGPYYALWRGRENGYRLYFVPDAKMLIFLPLDNRQIELHRFDFEQALKESGKDYLFLGSRPPLTVARGATYTYQVNVNSSPPKVKYTMTIGPEGMTVSPEGLVKWQVPHDFAGKQTEVVLTISNEAGKEVLQTCKLEIEGENTAPETASTEAVTSPDTDISTAMNSAEMPVIKPVSFKEDQKQIQLPAPMTDLMVGGGGRYLIMYLKNLKRLAVFDCSQAAIVKYLPVDSEDVLIAASGYHLIVLLRDKMLMQRWNLKTLQRELMIPAPTTVPVGGMVMGSASQGPLVLICDTGPSFLFLDPNTMQPIELELMRGSDRNRGTYRGVESRYLKYAHASANGRVIAVGETILLLNDMTYERRLSPRLFRSSGVRKEKDYGMRPNTDGSLIYAPLALYSINMARKESHRHGENLLIPATQPGFCVSVTGHYSRKGSTGVALCLEGESTPFAELKQVDVSLNRLPPDRVFSFTGMAYTKRYTLVPDARLLIQIPTGEDRLILHKVNPELLLKQSDHNYLYVTSGSLSEAHLGKPWQHQIEVQSKQGGVKYQLSYGPRGMSVSSTGLITWTPPEDFASPEEGTVFNVQDQSGKSIMHSVKVSIPGAAENAARRAEEQLAQFKAVKEAHERQAKERRAQELEKQRQRQLQKPAQGRMRRTPARQPRAVTTEYAVKVGPIAKAKAEANARALLQKQIEKLNQQKLNLRTRAWTDQKGNQFEAQLTRVFAGNGYFSTPVMKRDQSNLTLKLPLKKLSTEDRKYVNTITGYLADKRKLFETIQTEEHSPRLSMSQITSGLEPFTFRGSHLVPPYSVDPEGKPLLSWRVQILPAIGGYDLFQLFHHDEPWDSPHNRQLIPFMPDFYRSPDSKADTGKTNLLGVSGKHSLFSTAEEDEKSELKDSHNKTALLVEVPDSLAVEWTKPADWEFVDQNSIKSLYGFRPDGFYVLFADGKSEFISSSNSLRTLSRMFTCDDGQSYELKK